jgi:hypothetical protein
MQERGQHGPVPEKPVVSLSFVAADPSDVTHTLGLILLCPSGVIWTNQAGGTACRHPQAEGVYLPLWSPVEFPHICSYGYAVDSEGDVAAEVQAAIAAAGWPLAVDRSRADEAMEAWWPVTVNADAGADEYDVMCQFRGWRAILVTENCD